LGFWGDDLEITIAFPEPIEINSIKTRFYNANGQWLYSPEKIRVSGKTDTGVFMETVLIEGKASIINTEILLKHIPNCIVEEIILKVPSYGIIPDGLQGAGNNAWTFIDEIIVE